MPSLVFSNSAGADNRPVIEFNKCHGKNDGKFCDTPGGESGSMQRPKPIRVTDLDHAVELILQGKVVELKSTRQVNTVLTKLAAIAKDAKRRGEDAPNYDLCNVTVPKTNLFCGSKVITKEHPEGIARIHMPQLGGEPVPGSKADKLPRKGSSNEVNASDAFVAHLKSLGIGTTEGKIPAAELKASQSELIGRKVAKIMTGKKDPAASAIFVSRDNYIVDGHHRWAAVVGRDSSDGRLGDLKMKIIRIDAPISEVLKLANSFTKAFGIKAVAGPKADKPPKRRY